MIILNTILTLIIITKTRQVDGTGFWSWRKCLHYCHRFKRQISNEIIKAWDHQYQLLNFNHVRYLFGLAPSNLGNHHHHHQKDKTSGWCWLALRSPITEKCFVLPSTSKAHQQWTIIAEYHSGPSVDHHLRWKLKFAMEKQEKYWYFNPGCALQWATFLAVTRTF